MSPAAPTGPRGLVLFVLAKEAYPQLIGARQVEWLDRLDQENGNLMAAVSRALDTGDAETGARLDWALRLFWMMRGYQREGRPV